MTEKRPLKTNSLFELASLSKPFTALGIILLEEKALTYGSINAESLRPDTENRAASDPLYPHSQESPSPPAR